MSYNKEIQEIFVREKIEMVIDTLFEGCSEENLKITSQAIYNEITKRYDLHLRSVQDEN